MPEKCKASGGLMVTIATTNASPFNSWPVSSQPTSRPAPNSPTSQLLPSDSQGEGFLPTHNVWRLLNKIRNIQTARTSNPLRTDKARTRSRPDLRSASPMNVDDAYAALTHIDTDAARGNWHILHCSKIPGHRFRKENLGYEKWSKDG